MHKCAQVNIHFLLSHSEAWRLKWKAKVTLNLIISYNKQFGLCLTATHEVIKIITNSWTCMRFVEVLKWRQIVKKAKASLSKFDAHHSGLYALDWKKKKTLSWSDKRYKPWTVRLSRFMGSVWSMSLFVLFLLENKSTCGF